MGETPVTSATIKFLQPDTFYEVRARSQNALGSSTWVEAGDFRTWANNAATGMLVVMPSWGAAGSRTAHDLALRVSLPW